MTFNEYLEDMYQRVRDCGYLGSFEQFKIDNDISMMREDYEDSMGLPC